MTRVDVKQGVLEVHLKERSIVYVFPQSDRGQEEIDLPQSAPVVVNPETVIEAIQDFLDHGVDEGDRSGPWKKFEQDVKLARENGVSFSSLSNDLDLILAEVSRGLEGAKIGSVSKRFETIKGLILDIAEDTWTSPNSQVIKP